MVFEQITGFATNLTGIDPELLAMGAFITIFAVWLGLLLLTQLVLFIISIIKKDVDFGATLTKSFESFKEIYPKLVKYYAILAIPVIIISLADFIKIFVQDEMASAFIALFAAPFSIFVAIFVFVLDTSLAKSYYKTPKNFSLSWITGKQVGKLFVVGLIYLVFFVLSFLLLGFPLIILGLMLPFVRYPIIVSDSTVGESIKRAWAMVKKEFWNIFFFVSVYGIFMLVINLIFGWVPVIGSLISYLLIQPFATILFTDIYRATESEYLESDLTDKPKKDAVAKYIEDMKSQGFSEDQIMDALVKAGHTKASIKKYF